MSPKLPFSALFNNPTAMGLGDALPVPGYGLPWAAGAGDAPLLAEMAPPRFVTPGLPQRRTVRLAGYDYSGAGWYFVAIATQDHQPLFGCITPDARLQPTPLGEVISHCWHELTTRYEQLPADCWVLMPNHGQLLLGLLPATTARPAKPLGQLVGAFKAACTRLGRPHQPTAASWWQRNYHEHIIRTALDLENHRRYVRENPRRWLAKRGTI